MSVHESDGISEVFDDALRFGLTAAGRVAETRIRQREQQLRDAQAQGEQAERELRSRLDGERAAARAELSPIYHEQWWEHAPPEQIARAWETATQWRELDPDVQRAAGHIRGQLRDRYDIDVDQLPAADIALEGDAESRRAQAAREQATALLTRAERVDRTDEPNRTLEGHDASPPPYDSPRRRELLAQKLTAAGIEPDAIQARMLADISQAHPPQQAVADTPALNPTPGRARSVGARHAISRSDRGR